MNPGQLLIDGVMVGCFGLGAAFFVRGISEFFSVRRLARMKTVCSERLPEPGARAAFELFRLVENPRFGNRGK